MSTRIQRMSDRSRSAIDRILGYARMFGDTASLPPDAWTVDDVAGPNYTDKTTVVTMAKMAANAYVAEPWTGEWKDVKEGFNYTDDFGWQNDGLRGHIFADEHNKTVVIGLKGTSMAIFDGADTTGNDKLNDNLFASCCCAQGGQYLWRQVCDCMTDQYQCNNTCLVKQLQEKDHYYWAVRDLYHNVTERYPDSDIWLAGHSLGGVVSGLLGLTYGLPVMTYEAYPDALAASRLGLPVPPGYQIGSHSTRGDLGIHHYGHTADPIYMGSCNSASSLCTLAGYAMEGLCHTGKTCIYDTVKDLGWRVGVGSHRIVSVIKDVLMKYDTVPVCEEDKQCQDCADWSFYESNGTETTTTSKPASSTSTTTSTRTRTRTETCRTPGWWGCLDDTTTSGPTSTSSSTSKYTTTTTCHTPGWFGCRDPITTTETTSDSSTINTPQPVPSLTVTSTTETVSPTHSCETPGWFGGCRDPTTMSTEPSTTRGRHHKTAPVTHPSHTSCTSKEWFGLICVDPSPTTLTTTSSPTHAPKMPSRQCIRRHWYGFCWEWSEVHGQMQDL